MKILEACRKTGLTERTIRFYIEKGLLHPESSEQNGRVYYTFSTQDLEQLGKISTLRKTGFSIDDIAMMEKDPCSISRLLSAHIKSARGKEQEYAAILRALKLVAGRSFTTAGELAGALRLGVICISLPKADLQPNFARFDSETPEEREAGYADYLVQQRIRDKASTILKRLKPVAAVLCAGAALLLAAYGFSCIPKAIERTYDGADFRTEDTGGSTAVSIRVQGRLYRRLFEEPLFIGKIELDTVEYSGASEIELRFSDGMDHPAWLVYDRVLAQPGGVIVPDLQSFGMVLTDADFSYLVINCFDKTNGGGGSLGSRVICAPARSVEEGIRLLEEKNRMDQISTRQ